MSSSASYGSFNNSFQRLILPWIVWSLGCIFYFYESLLQVSPSVMGAELMRDFDITSRALGILSGIYYYSYSPMQLPCGLMMDRYGPRIMLTLATAICAISTIAFGTTNSLFMASIARLMIGFGSAFAAVGTMKLAANWFSPKRFALLTGLMITIGMLGAISGETPLALLVDYTGWRSSMVIMGFIGLVLALFIYLIAKDFPEHTQKVVHKHELPEQEPMLKSLIALLKNSQLWLVAVYGGLMYMATPVFCGLWGVPFLMLKMGIDKPTAANYISLVFIGWAIASPLWGVFSTQIGLRKPPMYIGAIGALSTSLLFIYGSIQSGLLMSILLLTFGLFSAGFLASFSVAKELCNKNYVGTGLGFMNMLNMVGIAIAQPLIGCILDYYWTGELVDNIRIYPLQAYEVGLAILPIGIFVALIILFWIKETYCRHVDDQSD